MTGEGFCGYQGSVRALIIVNALLFAACAGAPGDGDAGVVGGPDSGTVVTGSDAAVTSDSGTNDAGPLLGLDAGVTSGQLVGGPGPWPGAIAGVRYSSGSVQGVTDATGAFVAAPGQQVVFSVGDVNFAPVTPAAKVTAWQLVGSTCTRTAELEKALVLLFSLDEDNDSTNGLKVVATSPAALPVPLSLITLSDVSSRVGQLISGRVALAPAVALDRFIRQVDDETWAQLPTIDSFSGSTALGRGQGVATDGVSWFFSGTLSLERTNLELTKSEKSNPVAIPFLLGLAGSDHIGDIDVVNGTLYAPIEDGSKNYANPKVVTYNPQSLSPGTTYSISNTLQTKGVPWVAVNGPRNEAYLAEWDPTMQLNIFTLSTMVLNRSLPLTMPVGTPLGRVQGAKVFESALYMATDDSQKNVFKLDLETGTVLRLFSIDTTGEQEGLAFLARDDGSRMHTLNVNAARNGSEFRHHQRTRAPLRSEVCH